MYLLNEYPRFAKRYGVAMAMNPHFPINTLQPMRAVIGVQSRQADQFDKFLAAIFKACGSTH